MFTEIHSQIMRQLMLNKKYEAVTECAKLCNPDVDMKIVVSEYAGDVPRLMKRGNIINILCPKNINVVQENGIADAITNGTIFDDAEMVDRHADYLEKTTMPCQGMINKFGAEPKKLRVILTGIIGRISDDGTIEISVGDMTSGANFLNTIMSGKGHEHVHGACKHFLGIDPHEEFHDCSDLPKDIKKDIHDLIKEIDMITDVDPDDEVTDEDLEVFELKDKDDDDDEKEDKGDSDKDDDEDDDDDDEEFDESYYGESFRTRHPKKLKPIPRDVISYITVEMNAIRDSNDQAMIAGYCSAKLELVDFYLNCLDTQDPRYIVPHTKQYLTQMQSELNDLLKRILQIRPVNKFDRIWSGIL